MFVFFYIGTRMEFVLFDIVLLNEKFVAPSWRRHALHSWRWMGFKVLFSLLIAFLCGPLFYLVFSKLVPQLKAAAPAAPGQVPPHLFHNLIQLYAVIGLPIVFAILLSSLLTNFVLPSIALEDTTVREAFRRFLALASDEPGPVAAFVGFKILLGIAAFIAMEAAIFIGELLCLIPIGLVALAGWFLLRSAGDAGHLLMLAGAVLLLALFAVIVVYGSTIVLGCVHTFFQAYALYFLGGRYPLLGDMLEPPAPPVPYAPPQSPPAPMSPPGMLPLPPSEPAT
jgi:hypothetical protein